MKVNIKKIILIILIFFLVVSLVNISNASNAGQVKTLFSGNTSSAPEGSKAITNIIAAVLSVVRTAGTAVAIIILMTIAAKYIMASAGDRADIKKYAMNYVIGAIILFGATGILGVVQNFVASSVKHNG